MAATFEARCSGFAFGQKVHLAFYLRSFHVKFLSPPIPSGLLDNNVK